MGRKGGGGVTQGDERWGAEQELVEATDVTEEDRHADSMRLKQYLEAHPLKNADECVPACLLRRPRTHSTPPTEKLLERAWLRMK
jgi:hypothetical protein